MTAGENKPKSGNGCSDNKKRKQHYRPHNKAVKKGSYPLRPGVQGFFITCDGGRERQASHEAVQVIDSFYEELVEGKDSEVKESKLPNKPINKKIKFTYSDSDEDGSHDDDKENQVTPTSDGQDDANHGTSPHPEKAEGDHAKNETSRTGEDDKDEEHHENENDEEERHPIKKQCVESGLSKYKNGCNDDLADKSVDKLIEAELEELKDKSKRRFSYLDSGCNGVVFVQMSKRDGDPSPKEIAYRMMTSAAATRKHISRFILRLLPVEVTCYASEEEISRAIKPLVAQHFPAEAERPHKFAVLYEARANTGVDRMKIIDAVAKSVPEPHKVDLSNPDLNIVVQIAKTVCCIGVVEKYKELAKYNLRQLTSPK